ncbi:hypothetical protein OIU77_002596 [Salix suchowensis]|uniref:Uncharacterized protein n=1 Tax=Salix suchowensis TaxID=1278906 RepID=A0ABQ9AYW8_9ROSI|nr:hypothetical protein OIU77_002596 [Salix suchowensis]
MSLFSDSPHIYFGKKYVELHRQSVARSTNQRFFYSGGQKSEGCISHLNNINHVVGNNYILLHNICQKLGIMNSLHKTPVELLPTRSKDNVWLQYAKITQKVEKKTEEKVMKMADKETKNYQDYLGKDILNDNSKDVSSKEGKDTKKTFKRKDIAQHNHYKNTKVCFIHKVRKHANAGFAKK